MIRRILNAGISIYPLNSACKLLLNLRFFKSVIKNLATVKRFVSEIDRLGYSALFTHKIPVLGAVEWPYIHNEWDVSKRFDIILGHYQIVRHLPEFLNVADGHPKKILDLTAVSPGVSIVLDKAQWFVREGEIVLNLFKDDMRMMSVAFTLSHLNQTLVMYVGAIQGIHADAQSLNHIKQLTKDFEGLRPRDLLVEILRILAENLAVKNILGIADAYRHHRHPYFASYHKNTLKTSYDEIWQEQMGAPFGQDFYALPLTKPRKALEEVSSNKRAMYRRRYSILDNIATETAALFLGATQGAVLAADNMTQLNDPQTSQTQSTSSDITNPDNPHLA